MFIEIKNQKKIGTGAKLEKFRIFLSQYFEINEITFRLKLEKSLPETKRRPVWGTDNVLG